MNRVVPDQLAARLHAAAEDLAPTTLDNLGMREIARITGIPRATLYYHFASKDDLVAFLLRAMLEDLRHAVAAAVEQNGGVRLRLRAVVEAQFAHLAANPALGRLLLMNLGKLERFRILADGIEAGFRAPVRNLLREAVASGEIEALDADVVATALYGAVTILGLDALLRRGSLEPAALAASVFPFFWQGVAGGRL